MFIAHHDTIGYRKYKKQEKKPHIGEKLLRHQLRHWKWHQSIHFTFCWAQNRHKCAQRHNNALATAHQRKFTRYQKFTYALVHFQASIVPLSESAHFSTIVFLEMARLGYFLWTTGSLKASTICSLVEKVTNDLPCTSPCRWKKSTGCGQNLKEWNDAKIQTCSLISEKRA